MTTYLFYQILPPEGLLSRILHFILAQIYLLWFSKTNQMLSSLVWALCCYLSLAKAPPPLTCVTIQKVTLKILKAPYSLPPTKLLTVTVQTLIPWHNWLMCEWLRPGFQQQRKLSRSFPINTSILYSKRVWICNWSRWNSFHSNKS